MTETQVTAATIHNRQVLRINLNTEFQVTFANTQTSTKVKQSVLIFMTETPSKVVRITSVMLLPVECQQSMCVKVFITSYAQAHRMVNEVT